MTKRKGPYRRKDRVLREVGDIKSNGQRQGAYVPWTTTERNWLRDNYYLYCYTKQMLEHLPRHSYQAVVKMATQLGLKRTNQLRTPKFLYREVWWALHDHPMTCSQLAEYSGCSLAVVHKAIEGFRQAGVIHVERWAKPFGTGPWTAIWVVGRGQSAAKPKGLGETREIYDPALRKMKGNPWGALLIGASDGNAEHKEDVCA